MDNQQQLEVHPMDNHKMMMMMMMMLMLMMMMMMG